MLWSPVAWITTTLQGEARRASFAATPAEPSPPTKASLAYGVATTVFTIGAIGPSQRAPNLKNGIAKTIPRMLSDRPPALTRSAPERRSPSPPTPLEEATDSAVGVSPDTPNGDAGDTEDGDDLSFVPDQAVAGMGAVQGGAPARNGGSK